MEIKTIISSTNPLVKHVASLHDARERKARKQCIIEGVRALSTALTRLPITTLYCTQPMLGVARDLVDPRSIILVPGHVMQKMSAASTPSGLLGVFSLPVQPEVTSLTAGLVLARISDPGNMGTLIRTAVACGIKSIVVVEGTDPWSPKVIQASAGTITMVSIFQWNWQTLMASKGSLKLFGLVVEGGAEVGSLAPEQALMVVGNEAQGIPTEWLDSVDGRITLPMPGGTESLNAAIAGSIAVYLTFCGMSNRK